MNRRKIRLDGADNVRDLGEIPNKEGRVIAKNKLIRANQLSQITESDAEKLSACCNVKTVIDLRTEAERRERPDADIPGARPVHIPIFDEAMIGITHEGKADKAMENVVEAMPDISQMYAMMLRDDRCTAKFAEALKVIISEESGAVLWHCTEGKDRCGVLTALVLYILGVDRQNIYDDYLLTNDTGAKRSESVKQLVLQKTGDSELSEKVAGYFIAREEYLGAAFAQMEKECGSMDRFISQRLGISAEMCGVLRSRVLR